jgi:hypothetical protein
MAVSYLLRFIAFAGMASSGAAQDTIRIRADSPPLWGENVRLVPEVRLGVENGPPAYALGNVAAVAAFPDGSFFVYDRPEATIRRYDAAGRYVAVVARKGSGPGEILDLGGMKTVGDSLLAVWDRANSRVSIYDRTGKWLRGFVTNHGGLTLGGDVFATDAAGYVALRVARPARGAVTVSAPSPVGGREMVSSPSAPGTIQVEHWMRYSSAGRLIDSIRTTTTVPLRRAITAGRLVNFSDRSVTALLRGAAVITGWPDPYRLTVRRPGGGSTVIERSFRPIPLAGEERDEWAALHAALTPKPSGLGSSDGWRTPEESVGMAAVPLQLPDTKPGFADLQVDPLDRIWVEIYTATTKHRLPPQRPGDSPMRISWFADPVYEVFDQSGRFLGRIALPPETSLLAVQRNRIWLRTEGPAGEPVIAVYRIVGSGGP